MFGEVELHVHHIVPRSQDGADEDTNLMVLCASCHWEWTHTWPGNSLYDFIQWLNIPCTAANVYKVVYDYPSLWLKESFSEMGEYMLRLVWGHIKSRQEAHCKLYNEIYLGLSERDRSILVDAAKIYTDLSWEDGLFFIEGA